ncbi:MAG TPA: nucleotide sugar dehydrogenase [Candidatus Methylomirabilis sp.]|nr:nucleotide sugar dehydrogenase [Candidatus Methylomirabilis sp.]
MRVSVFGLGYVGSVTATCLAAMGHEVIGVDSNAARVEMVNTGHSPVTEPQLAEILSEIARTGQLRATVSAATAATGSDVAFVCVGTPSQADGQPDLGALRRVVEDIGAALRGRRRPFRLVIRSTVLPGTTEHVVLPVLRSAAGPAAAQMNLAVNPEFMREGSGVQDFRQPPYTLVGSDDQATVETLAELYGQIDAPFVATTVRSAEMVKYVSNAFHALKVCFANEIGDISSALGADQHEVMRIFAMDRKLNISPAYLRPGWAFGGSCLPKDVRGLVHAARTADVAAPLLSAILPSNEAQIGRVTETVLRTGKRRVGVLGLSFKPGTDDLRESPLVLLVETLVGKGRDVKIFDRAVWAARLVGANRRYLEQRVPHFSMLLCDDVEALLAHADVLIIGNAGDDARTVLSRIRSDQIVVDLTRGVASRSASLEG